MTSKNEFIIDASKIEQIRVSLDNRRKSKVRTIKSVDTKLSLGWIDQIPCQDESLYEDQTLQIEIWNLRQRHKLKSQCLLCLLTLCLQLAIFYHQSINLDLLLNCISILTILCIGIQILSRSSPAQAFFKCSLFLIHPSILTHEANHYLHLLMSIRILLVVEYLFKDCIWYSGRCERVLGICGLEGEGDRGRLFLFTVRACLNSFRVTTIIALYILSITLFSHLLVIASAWTQPVPDSFSTCFQIISTIFTTVGYGQYNNIDTMPKRVVITLALCFGIMSNSFVTLMSLSRLLMDNRQANSYNIWKLLEIRLSIAVSSARFLHKSLLKKTANSSQKYQLYRQFQKDIFQHKNCIKSINRKGIMQFLTSSFRSNLQTLNRRHIILHNLILRTLTRLSN